MAPAVAGALARVAGAVRALVARIAAVATVVGLGGVAGAHCERGGSAEWLGGRGSRTV